MSSATFSSACLVSASDNAASDALEKAGGTWVDDLGGWVFSESQRQTLSSSLANQGIAVSGTIAAASSSAPPAVAPSVNANAALTVKKHKKAILVLGDTFNVKDQLKALGGSWNRGLVGWIFKGSAQQQVLDLLKADSTNTVDNQCGGGGAAAGSSSSQASQEAFQQPAAAEVKVAKTEAPPDDLDEEDQPLSKRKPAKAPAAKKKRAAPAAKVPKKAAVKAKPPARKKAKRDPEESESEAEESDDDDDEEEATGEESEGEEPDGELAW